MGTKVPNSAAIYSPIILRFAYDAWVLGVSNHLAWKAPTSLLRQFFEANVLSDHLETGAGTGYFPDRCRFPGGNPRITLLDVNPHCLAQASRRLTRYRPETILADVTRPVPLAQGSFGSIHLGFLLHCLPGSMAAKGRVLDNLVPLLRPDGVLFGTTLLPDGGNRFARLLTNAYNRKGIFGNRDDTIEGLRDELCARFPVVTVERVGQAALFTGRMA
jgi:SAM-dependent methyltransferase